MGLLSWLHRGSYVAVGVSLSYGIRGLVLVELAMHGCSYFYFLVWEIYRWSYIYKSERLIYICRAYIYIPIYGYIYTLELYTPMLTRSVFIYMYKRYIYMEITYVWRVYEKIYIQRSVIYIQRLYIYIYIYIYILFISVYSNLEYTLRGSDLTALSRAYDRRRTRCVGFIGGAYWLVPMSAW